MISSRLTRTISGAGVTSRNATNDRQVALLALPARARASASSANASHRLANLDPLELPKQITGSALDDPVSRSVAGKRFVR